MKSALSWLSNNLKKCVRSIKASNVLLASEAFEKAEDEAFYFIPTQNAYKTCPFGLSEESIHHTTNAGSSVHKFKCAQVNMVWLKCEAGNVGPRLRSPGSMKFADLSISNVGFLWEPLQLLFRTCWNLIDHFSLKSFLPDRSFTFFKLLGGNYNGNRHDTIHRQFVTRRK